MRKLLMLPTPTHASNDTSNSINQIVLRLRDHLPEFGYELTEYINEAEFIAGHAGQTHSAIQVDVAHCHGLYPTAYPLLTEPWHTQANQAVINNLITAKVVTVPSEWVAQIIRRDMHINPQVIPWGLDFEKWQPGENRGYVLWNKTRVDGVCDPQPIVELAKAVPQTFFMSTYGEKPTSNLKIIGRQTYDNMKPLIRSAGVYLATTKETGGIGILEAMACGIPVLGYRHGNIVNLIKHGVTGYLVEPGDINGLIEGLAYCQKWRDRLGANAREIARLFTWDKVAQAIAGVYDGLFETPELVKVAVVIPHHNYARYLPEAIQSVLNQECDFKVEIVVVDDGSAPDQALQARQTAETLNGDRPVRFIEQQNAGVANTRNKGIASIQSDYVVCLDADDKLGNPKFLQQLADALDSDRTLGIAFTGLQTIDDSGIPGAPGQWPNGFNWDQQIAGRNQVPTCCMFRREAWKRAGGYKSQYQPAEDAELWTRIVALGFKAKQVIADPWFTYRVHNGSLSADIRHGKKSEPDWRTDKPWVTDKQFPFAADGKANPVRNYDKPKVAIIVPVAKYHVPYLAQALDSVEKQTERYWECIVVNDTGEDLPGLGPFPWAKVIDTRDNSKGTTGAGAARNMGVAHSVAPFVTFLDADDMLTPRFLEATLKAYQKTGRYIYTDWISLNKAGVMETHETPEFVTGDVFRKPVQHAVNILMKRDWFDKVHGFDETMDSWEDVDFFMRLGRAGICGARAAEPLFIYRYTTGQRREKGETQKAAIIEALNKKFGEYISGTMACGCDNNGTKSPLTQNGVAVGKDALIRVIYNGPPGQMSVVGSATKTIYGYRSGGETFYVKAADIQAAPNKFVVIAEISEEKIKTIVPPPPPIITHEEDIA